VPMPDDSFNRFAGDPQVWWKALHMSAWLDEDPQRRAVWIDDDLAAPATHAHFAQHYPDRLLMLAPRFSTGLLASHLRTVRDFLDPRPRSERRAARRTRLLTGTATDDAAAPTDSTTTGTPTSSTPAAGTTSSTPATGTLATGTEADSTPAGGRSERTRREDTRSEERR